MCLPGESRVCVGAGACNGGQQCLSDGRGYGPCDCGNAVDAGLVDLGFGPADSGVAGAPDTGEDAQPSNDAGSAVDATTDVDAMTGADATAALDAMTADAASPDALSGDSGAGPNEVVASFAAGRPYAQARSDCQARGGDMVWIHDSATNTAVHQACDATFDVACRLGIRFPFTTWDNGDPVTYSNWDVASGAFTGLDPLSAMRSSNNQPAWATPGTWDDMGFGNEETIPHICRLPAGGNTVGAILVVPLNGPSNNPPSTPGLTLPLTVATHLPIVCEVTNPSTDPEGDPIQYHFTWTRNGSVYGAPLQSTHYVNDTIPAFVAADGDVWSCTVYASDGIRNSVTAVAGTTSFLPDLRPNLLGYWPLDDLGGPVVDASGSGWNGTPVGLVAANYAQPGRVGGALYLTGAGWVDLGPAPGVAGQSQLSWGGWYFKTGATYYGAIGKCIDNNCTFYLVPSEQRAECLMERPVGPPSLSVSSANVLPLNAWIHAVCTFDGTTLRLYVNGALVDSDAGAASPTQNHNVRMALGDTSGTGRWPFQGLLDDWAIWSRALSPDEVASWYAGGVGRRVVP